MSSPDFPFNRGCAERKKGSSKAQQRPQTARQPVDAGGYCIRLQRTVGDADIAGVVQAESRASFQQFHIEERTLT